MASDRNTLRYGTISEVLDVLKERPPEDMDEARAALMNAFEQLRAFNAELERVHERLAEIAPELQ